MSYKLLHIRSQDRVTSTDSPNSFSVAIPDRIEPKYKSFSLVGYVFPNSAYNVNSTNQSFYISDNNGGVKTATITLTNQNYTGTNLAAEIQSKLQASSLTNALNYTCTFSTTTNKLTIALSGGDVFQLNFAHANTSSEAYLLLGFNKSSTTAAAASRTSTNVVDLSGLKSVIVSIDAFKMDDLISTTSTLGQIYIPLGHLDAGENASEFSSDSLAIYNDDTQWGKSTWQISVWYNNSLAPLFNEWEMLLRINY